MASNDAVVETYIVGHHAPALAGTHVLVHLETEDSYIAESPDLLPANAPAVTLGAIFQQENASPLCHLAKGLGIARRATHVYEDDAGGPRGDLALGVTGIEAECVVDV